MFRFEVFVDDKHLSYVLWALSGHVVSVSTPQPVANAKRTKNGIAAEGGGRLIDIFTTHLRKAKPAEINAQYVQDFMQENGLNPGSFGHVLKEARTAGLIRKVGKGIGKKGSRYIVLPAAKKR